MDFKCPIDWAEDISQKHNINLQTLLLLFSSASK